MRKGFSVSLKGPSTYADHSVSISSCHLDLLDQIWPFTSDLVEWLVHSYRFNEIVKRFLGTIGKVHGDNRLESVIECQSFKLINITDTFLDVNHVIVSISSWPCFPVKPVSIDMIVEITSKMEERHCIKRSLDRRYQTYTGVPNYKTEVKWKRFVIIGNTPYITGKLSRSLPVLWPGTVRPWMSSNRLASWTPFQFPSITN